MNQTRNYVQEPETLVVARFQDCDPFGHLNNARYIDYFFNARQDQVLEHYGVRLYQPESRAGWVVRKTQIAYVRPVTVQEPVRIRTRLIQFGETSVVVEGLMLDRGARHLKALLWADFVYVSLESGRPAKHPAELMELFRAVAVTEDYEPNGFNRRVEFARRHLRQPADEAAAIDLA
jgi:acyl-CoA thioester hydrolase